MLIRFWSFLCTKRPHFQHQMRFKLEARGFEPLSRDISGRSSTCIVGTLGFAQQNAYRQACCIAISLRCRLDAAKETSQLSRFASQGQSHGKRLPLRVA